MLLDFVLSCSRNWYDISLNFCFSFPIPGKTQLWKLITADCLRTRHFLHFVSKLIVNFIAAPYVLKYNVIAASRITNKDRGLNRILLFAGLGSNASTDPFTSISAFMAWYTQRILNDKQGQGKGKKSYRITEKTRREYWHKQGIVTVCDLKCIWSI